MSSTEPKFGWAIGIGVMVVVFFAFMDALSFFNLYANQAYSAELEPGFGRIFWVFAYGMIALLAVGYFTFVRRDFSETLAVIITPILLLWAGLEDILYGPFTRQMIWEYPWLNDNVPGIIPTLLGFPNVPLWGLFVNMAVVVVILAVVIKLLRDI